MIKETLLLKYLSGEASEMENEEVLQWVEASPANRRKFLEYKKVWVFTAVDHTDQEQVWQQVQIRIKSIRKREKRRKWYYAVAACIAILVVLGSVYLSISTKTNGKGQGIQNEIVLELEDGTQQIIRSTDRMDIVHKGAVVGIQTGGRMEYTAPKDSGYVKTLVYNTLYVPYGKKFTVELSDGTVVDLNSGSRLKYPVQFLSDRTRQVFLEGEAYFTVTQNREQAFEVHANDLTTRVYGTEFNISSYPSNTTDHVVLVEGKIGFSYREQNETILEPSELISIHKGKGVFSKSKVDVQKYIAWKDGILWFDAEPFESISRTLERNYNVIIDNKMEHLNTIKFTGTFDHNESIEEILEVFADYKSFRYKKENNHITIY